MVDGFSLSVPCPANKFVDSFLHTEGGYPPRVFFNALYPPSPPLMICHLSYGLVYEQQVFSLEYILDFPDILLHKNGIYTDGRLA